MTLAAVVDCGHACCPDRHDPNHGHPRTPDRCLWCEAARLVAGAPVQRRLAPGDPRHGTHVGYGYWGCRCEPCRDANSVACRAYRDAPPPNSIDRAPWMVDALCRGARVDMWFPQPGEPVEPAQAVCAVCPVAEECVNYAIEHGIGYGIWGGRGLRERRVLIRARRMERLAS